MTVSGRLWIERIIGIKRVPIVTRNLYLDVVDGALVMNSQERPRFFIGLDPSA